MYSAERQSTKNQGAAHGSLFLGNETILENVPSAES